MRSERAVRYQRRSRRVAPADTYPPHMSLSGMGWKGMNLFFKNFEKNHGPILTPPADTYPVSAWSSSVASRVAYSLLP